MGASQTARTAAPPTLPGYNGTNRTTDTKSHQRCRLISQNATPACNGAIYWCGAFLRHAQGRRRRTSRWGRLLFISTWYRIMVQQSK
jgi:hypothetical protein